MSRKFIATIMAATLAVTSISATPAAAGNENLEKFLLGAGTLLIIGSVLDGGSRVETHEVRHGQRYKQYEYGHDYHPGRKNLYRYRPAPLPRFCLTRVHTKHGPVRMFSRRCLKRNYRHAEWLPNSCRISVKTWRQGHKIKRVGYKPRCLRSKGFRIAGRY